MRGRRTSIKSLLLLNLLFLSFRSQKRFCRMGRLLKSNKQNGRVE